MLPADSPPGAFYRRRACAISPPSVFYSYFAALGYDVAVEESSSHGRLDGRAHRRLRVPVRVQGGRDGAARFRPRPVAGTPLCRQVPAPPASRFTSSASSSAAPPATSPPSRPPTPDGGTAARSSAAVSAAGPGPAPVRAGSGLPAGTGYRPAPGSRCPGTAAAAPPPGSRGGTS